MAESIESELLKFLQGLRPENEDIGLDTDLISSGVLDSLAVLELVTFASKQFSVSIPVTAITPDNLRTVATLKHLIEGQIDG